MYPLQIQEKYDQSKLSSLGHRFSVVYLGTYLDGDYTESAGSHPGVDIVPATPHQEVKCVLDGTVFKLGNDPAYGNYVFIEHTNVPHPENLSTSTTLYSCYEHLESICVELNQSLKEGQTIGKTGNTGLSFGEHLHFQIDRKEAPYHAYWPYSGTEAKQAGLTFSQGVNKGLGREKAKLYTVNPLVYLDMVSKNVQSSPLLSQTITPPPAPTVTIETVKKDAPVVIASGIGSVTAQHSFGDLPTNDPLSEYIQSLSHQGVISGFEDGTFRPKSSVTRGELLKILFLYAHTPLSDDKKSYFSDVPSGSWQLKYVNTALANRMITLKNKKFNPSGTVSRAEALKMILGLVVGEISNTYTQSLHDVQPTDWFAKYVEYSVNHGLLSSDTHFYPNKDLTRYELVGILKKVQDVSQ